MKTYDVKCPICGHVNHNLFLEETDGWMECDNCKQIMKSTQFGERELISVFTMKGLAKQSVQMHFYLQ